MHASPQSRAVVSHAFERVGLVQDLQGPGRGRERYRMGSISAAMGHAATELAHDALASCQHGDWIAIRDSLGERAKVGLHAVEFLHPATRHAKTRLHFVDEKDG